MMRNLFRFAVAALLLLCSVALFAAPTVSAHAVLTKAVPEPNSRLDEPPARIELTFNERLEAELYYIKVFDEIGRQIADRKAALSPDQKVVSLDLPKLSDGRYTVTYHVISADGHPVEGTYVLTVGKAADGAAAGPGESLHHGHQLSAEMSVYDILKYASRAAYYFALLALAGWVVWGLLAPVRLPEAADHYRRGLLALQRAHLLALIAFVYLHYQELIGDEGAGQLLALFTGTWVGRSWLAALLLSLIGFALLNRWKAADGAWLMLLLGAKSLSGHAMGHDPLWVTIPLDIAHLLAASVWAGGLLLILTAWKRHRSWLDGFLPRFSNAALLSLVALILSGAATTLLYLPGLNYLLFSQWGKFLITKVVFVVLVVLLGAGIRYAMKKRKERDLRDMVRMDFAAMAIIVVLVGLLTYISPVPPNEPLYWHVMGEKVHMTVQISPKVPGDNRFRVDVWLPAELGEPKQVQLKLHNLDKPDIAPIDVPLAEHRNEEEDATFTADDTYRKYSYKADGPYLPFAGLWKLEFRVMDKNDDETVYEEETRVY